MWPPTAPPSRIERWLPLGLRAALVLSTLLLFTGLLLGGDAKPLAGGTLGSLLTRAARAEGPALVELGLLVMMVAPVARVVVLGVAWLVERHWLAAAMAGAVLVLLGASMWLGIG